MMQPFRLTDRRSTETYLSLTEDRPLVNSFFIFSQNSLGPKSSVLKYSHAYRNLRQRERRRNKWNLRDVINSIDDWSFLLVSIFRLQ